MFRDSAFCESSFRIDISRSSELCVPSRFSISLYLKYLIATVSLVCRFFALRTIP